MDSITIPRPGGTRALLQSLAPSLVPSERRVVQLCIDYPELAAQSSVAEIADHAAVSRATVVRACQRLGLRGYQHLRELLIRDQGVLAMPVAGDAGDTGEGDSDHLVEAVFERAIRGIRGALGALDLDAFDAAARSIRDGNRLLVVGNGASLPAAQSVALHFLTSGRVCESPADIVTQHIAARTLRPGDVCLAVSDSGMNRFTVRGASLASESGATVVAITSYGKSELAEIAHYALVAGAEFHQWNDGTVTGNVVQMLLLSALHSAASSGTSAELDARNRTIDEVRSIVGPVNQAESTLSGAGTSAVEKFTRGIA